MPKKLPESNPKAFKSRKYRRSMFKFIYSKKTEKILTYFYLGLCVYGAVMLILASLKLLGVF